MLLRDGNWKKFRHMWFFVGKIVKIDSKKCGCDFLKIKGILKTQFFIKVI